MLDALRNIFGGAILSENENCKKLEALVLLNSWDSLLNVSGLDNSSKIENLAFTANEFNFYDCIIHAVFLLT